MIQGKHLNPSMFLSLALEYTEALNSKETPTVLTALDRVVQSETVKILDECFDAFKNECQEAVNEDTMPLPIKDFRKILKNLIKKYRS